MLEWIGCDRCVAQALYMVQGPIMDGAEVTSIGKLYFCGHHFTEYYPGLDKWALEIIELEKQEEEAVN